MEADVLITSLTLAKPYTDVSPFPNKAYTNHFPLQWIKTAVKGLVTGWRTENLAGMHHEIHYRPGPMNEIPDALSRYLFLGPQCLTRTGSEQALSFLLDNLTSNVKSQAPRFWATRDMPRLIDPIRRWEGGRVRNTRAPKTAAADILFILQNI